MNENNNFGDQIWCYRYGVELSNIFSGEEGLAAYDKRLAEGISSIDFSSALEEKIDKRDVNK